MKWFYSLYPTRLKYQIDKEAMVAYVDVNKPDRYIVGDDRNTLNTLIEHFTTAGYCVIVRD
jgi:hypothetical protein